MGVLIGAGILSVCGLVACWLIFRRPLRQIFEDVHEAIAEYEAQMLS